MSVAAKLTRLSEARDAIITALGSQGVTATGHGFEAPLSLLFATHDILA